jgi:uncharacterized damage-inducible protein DinB
MVSSDGAEHQALLIALRLSRSYLIENLEGLGEEALRRPILPSGWTCLGLINHLALDVELFWFQAVIAGKQEAIDQVLATSSDNAWMVESNTPVASILEGYQEKSEGSDEVLASSTLDGSPAWWPNDLFGSWRIDTVRGIVLHTLRETATHAGQLDVMRELIDGKLHVVLTD